MQYIKLIMRAFSLPFPWRGAGGEAILFLFFSLPASAQSLSECLSIAEQNNPGVAAATKAIEQAKALEGTSFELDPTDITLSQDLTGGGSPDNGITVSQQFALPSLYKARRRQLKAETELERRSRDVVVRQLRQEVTAAYYTLLYIRARATLLQSQDSIYAEFVRLATAKCRGGETSRLEQLNAERTAHDNHQALLRAQGDERLAQARLQTLMGTDSEVTLAGATLTAVQPVDGQTTFALTPEGSYLAQQVSVGQLQLQTLRRENLPKLTVGMTGQLVLSGINPYNVDRSRFTDGNLMAFEVGVSVPLSFGAQRARKRAAQAGIALAQLRQQQAERQRDGALREAALRVEQARQTMLYYETTTAHADDIARTSTVAYEQGEIGYVEHTQNLRAAIDTRLARLDALNEYNQEQIKWNFSMTSYETK